MKKRTRLILSACSIALGVTTLGYWYYVGLVMQGFVEMFEALGFRPEVSPEPLIWILLPYLGTALVLVGLALALLPVIKRQLDAWRQ